MPSKNRSRAWTVYDSQGNRLHELRCTASAIRETLPNALIEIDTGRVTIMVLGQSITRAGSAPVRRGESVELFDPA